ncbi:hypothetical protein [uncultured Algibacter sp.]|uniref:hypothetical protein n=1 Tax=uncultured Algibacter sp. TaxID=298659 RepID=UPI0030EB57B2|tara:strand:+ start:2186 stop:2677 length:492 start_codon:yes stop_codon:yes gene_type:complete
MKTLLLNLALLILLVAVSCKKKQETKPVTHEEITESIVKQDISIEYTPIYLSPKARPIVVAWKEYIDVQNKVYELKNTDTVKLEKQLNDLDDLMMKLLNSETPAKLQSHLFERKLDLLGESVTDLKVLLGKESTQLEDIKKGVYKILQGYGVSKNQINAIYGG